MKRQRRWIGLSELDASNRAAQPPNVCYRAWRSRSAQVVFVVAIFAVCSTMSVSAQTDAQFAKANQAYAQGHFKEAIDGYDALVRSGQWSANLFYDLGNAYFRAGDFGRAILNYERALTLERRHPEATANLQIARDEARALELQPSWPERYLQFATLNQYTVTATIAFWIAAFCLVALIFARRRSATMVVSLVVMLSLFAAAIFAVWQLDRGVNGRSLAIVTAEDLQARVATADTANSVLALPAGSQVKILSTRGDWIYAALPNNQRGWIPAKSAEQIRL